MALEEERVAAEEEAKRARQVAEIAFNGEALADLVLHCHYITRP